MNYELILKPSAEKQLHRLPKSVQARVLDKLVAVQADPHLPGAIKLAGATTAWRVRLGDYRVVYEIKESRRSIFVTIIAHRREVYRDL